MTTYTPNLSLPMYDGPAVPYTGGGLNRQMTIIDEVVGSLRDDVLELREAVMQKKKTKSSKAGAKMNKPLLKKKTASWAGDPEHFLPKSEAMKIIQANTDLANRCNELDVLHERAKERALKAEAELAEWKKKVTDREELEKKVAEAEKRREDDKERIMDLEHFVWVMTGQLNHFMLRGMVE